MDITKLVADDGEEIELTTNLVWYVTTDAVGQLYVYDADGEPLHRLPIPAEMWRPDHEVVADVGEVLRDHLLRTPRIRREIDKP